LDLTALSSADGFCVVAATAALGGGVLGRGAGRVEEGVETAAPLGVAAAGAEEEEEEEDDDEAEELEAAAEPANGFEAGTANAFELLCSFDCLPLPSSFSRF